MRKAILSFLLSGSLLAGAFAFPVWGSAPALCGTAVFPADKDALLSVGEASSQKEDASDAEEEAASGTGKRKIKEVTDADGLRHTMAGVTADFYIGSADELYSLDLYFVDDVMDLPYLELEDLGALLCFVQNEYMENDDYNLSFEADEELAALTRENDYMALFDFDECSIRFDDYDAFLIGSGERFLVDLLDEEDVSEAQSGSIYERLGVGTYDRYGAELVLSLGDYGINLYRDKEEGRYYVPMQTMSDFLFSPSTGAVLLYNGNAAFLASPDSIGSRDSGYTELGELYHDQKEKRERSEDLALFSYGELCLALDHLYGLKQTHQIESFDELFKNTGLEYSLLSTDPVEADEGLNQLIEYYLDDLHSGFIDPSCLSGDEELEEEVGLSNMRSLATDERYAEARAAWFDDDVPAYEEIGNTAYITFDNFQASHSSGEFYEIYGDGSESEWEYLYANTDELAEDGSDTRQLIIEAHRAITREDSPIENVVLDLSCNGGGTVNSAVFVLSWFLGIAPLTVQDTLTNAISSSLYTSDVNLDHVFDRDDILAGKRLFCIISPSSFSCGNLLPAVFKESNKVTLIGQRSGGGSCVVMSLSTAYGSLFCISGCYRLSTMKNGSVYDVDLGVEPDVYISDPNHLYDREYLTEYINELP